MRHIFELNFVIFFFELNFVIFLYTKPMAKKCSSKCKKGVLFFYSNSLLMELFVNWEHTKWFNEGDVV
jgi:hypothetical protein